MPRWRDARSPRGRTRSCARPRTPSACPPGQMGNSEVGHLNLGAGRPVLQDLPRIDAAIADGSFFTRPALLAACERAKETGRLHAVGLIGPGGVHAHDRHLRRARRAGGAPGRAVRPGPRAARRPRHAAQLRARVHARPRGPPGGGPPGRPDRVGRRPLLRDGPRQALGAHGARLRRDRPRRGAPRRLRHRGDRGGLRPRRDRRVRRADGRSTASTARCATATRSSTSTSAPTAPGSSRTRCPSPRSTPSTAPAPPGSRRRRTSSSSR